jgi:hypothetical protein
VNDRLAYTLQEAAECLGGISVRSVQRLVSRGALRTIPLLRRVLIPADALRALVATGAPMPDNPNGAEPVAWKGVSSCHLNARIHRSGTRVSPMQAERELNVLLEQLTSAKQKR